MTFLLRFACWIVVVLPVKLCLAQDNLQINGNNFQIVYKESDDALHKRCLELCRGKQRLLSHTVIQSDGDCSSENLELGMYEVKENQLILYSYWASGDRMGSNIFPYGFRKQVYKIANNGSVVVLSSQIYLEKTAQGKALLMKNKLIPSEKRL